MASYSPTLLEKKYHNWVKAGLAVLFTKEGIEPFVYDEMQQFQLECLDDICYNNGLMNGTTCSNCCTENVVACPTRGICTINRGKCKYHKNSTTQYNPSCCPNTLCHNFKNRIQSVHRFNGPSYRNTDATQWCSNQWEVAKCFMPPDGYKDVTCATETDFNGINSVIINHKGFQSKIHDNLGNMNNIFAKARLIGRDVRHSPSLEVDDTSLSQYFAELQLLLSDSGYLNTNTHAQYAKQKLSQLQNDTLIIGKEEVRIVLDDVAKAVQDKIRSEIDEQKKESVKQKHELLKASRTALDSLKNKEKVSVAELNNALSSALHQIEEKTEQSLKRLANKTNDLVKTLDTKASEGVEKINDKMADSVQSLETKIVYGVEMIDGKTDDSVKTLETKTEEGVEKIKQTVSTAIRHREEDLYNNLRDDLIQHYRKQYNKLPITPLLDGIIDVPLLEMYVPPFPMVSVETDNLKLISMPKREEPNTDGFVEMDETEELKCKSLSDVFCKNKKTCKNIYVTAEPGFGKLSFVRWLVLTWCQARNPSTDLTECFSDTDLQQMREFEFVFLVLLRDTEETHVDKMIANHLISLLGRQSLYTTEVIENILSTRKCLLILDGLDEWNSSNDQLPITAARDTCVFITTSRPWKMATVSHKSSPKDQHIQIKDLQGICTDQILPKLLNIFREKGRLRSDCKDECSFLQMLEEKKIQQFAASPVMLMHILYLWNFDKTIGNSQCQIYSNIVDALLARAVEKGTVPLLSRYENVLSSTLSYYGNEAYNCGTYYKLLHDLGNVAFQTLFSVQKESSLVFQKKDLKQYTPTGNNDEFFDTVVKVGLLSQEMHMTPRRKEYSYSFYHKTIQEYFAALYIQFNPGDHHVIEKITTRCNTVSSVLEMETVFMFLSGCNPQIACEVLQNLQGTINADPTIEESRSKSHFFRDNSLMTNVQRMILSCVQECRSNGNELLVSDTSKNAIQFPLCDIVLDHYFYTECCCTDMEYIIKCNGSRIKSLFIINYDNREGTGLTENLTYSNVDCLEYLDVRCCNKLPPLLSSLDRLVHLKSIYLGMIDLGERLVLGPGMKHIECVELSDTEITNTAFHMLVGTVLTCEHSVTVELYEVTVNDRTVVKQEETVKHDISTLPTFRGERSDHGRKIFHCFGVIITTRTLQEFVYTVEKCQHPVQVALYEINPLKPDTEHASKNDDERLHTNDEEGYIDVDGSDDDDDDEGSNDEEGSDDDDDDDEGSNDEEGSDDDDDDDEGSNDEEGYQKVKEYIRSSSSFKVQEGRWHGYITFMTKYEPENSDNDTSDESDYQ